MVDKMRRRKEAYRLRPLRLAAGSANLFPGAHLIALPLQATGQRIFVLFQRAALEHKTRPGCGHCTVARCIRILRGVVSGELRRGVALTAYAVIDWSDCYVSQVR